MTQNFIGLAADNFNDFFETVGRSGDFKIYY